MRCLALIWYSHPLLCQSVFVQVHPAMASLSVCRCMLWWWPDQALTAHPPVFDQQDPTIAILWCCFLQTNYVVNTLVWLCLIDLEICCSSWHCSAIPFLLLRLLINSKPHSKPLMLSSECVLRTIQYSVGRGVKLTSAFLHAAFFQFTHSGQLLSFGWYLKVRQPKLNTSGCVWYAAV